MIFLRFFWILFSIHVVPVSAQEGFLIIPLDCKQPTSKSKPCPDNAKYSLGPYTSGMINTLLDHQMAVNSGGKYSYRQPNTTNGLDGVIVAFNGERVGGPTLSSDATSMEVLCVGGHISLLEMMNSSGCGANYTSYDEHPGYDYKASTGTSIKAAADGKVVNNGGQRCILNGMSSCDSWGYVGIDHVGYVTQYGHLSHILVTEGQEVRQGDVIGYSGNEAPPPNIIGPHLHFEVLARIPDSLAGFCGNQNYYNICRWAAVDPYGWTGTTNPNDDPIYSRAVYGIMPKKLWVASNTPTTIVFQPGSEGFDTAYGSVYAPGTNGNVDKLYYGGWGDYYYDFFRWDMSSLPLAANVSKVLLYLYFNVTNNDPAFQVQRVTSSWDEETLTRSNNPSATFWGNWTGIKVNSGWYSLDITELYKNWKNGTWPNYGIKLVPTANNNTNGNIISSDYQAEPTLRPKLVITTQ